MSTGSRPQDLSLRGIQLEPVGTHPPGNIINTVGDGVSYDVRRRYVVYYYLGYVCLVCAK